MSAIIAKIPIFRTLFKMLHQEVVLGLSLADWLALCWFVLCWAGYTRYAERKALRRDCLASVLHRQRRRWMHEMLGRENRVADASLMANLERNVAFFASSTLIILAGVFTVLSATDKAISIAAELPFAVGASAAAWEVKLILLAGVFVYAFFKFTWSLRQYGFAAVVIGMAPGTDSRHDVNLQTFADEAAQVISRAALAFNLGLRSYYYGLAFLIWFVNPWFFALATTWVVAVLYRREFKSNVLQALVRTYNA